MTHLLIEIELHHDDTLTDWLIDHCLTSRSRISRSYRDSQLPVKGGKFGLMPSAYDLWAGMALVVQCLLWHGTSVYKVLFEGLPLSVASLTQQEFRRPILTFYLEFSRDIWHSEKKFLVWDKCILCNAWVLIFHKLKTIVIKQINMVANFCPSTCKINYVNTWHNCVNMRLIYVNLQHNYIVLFVCLFGVYRPTREFFTHMETLPLPVKGCKFWPICSSFMATEQWGFFSVPHSLWHGASVYIVHLRGPMTLTPIAERLAVELSLPVLTT